MHKKHSYNVQMTFDTYRTILLLKTPYRIIEISKKDICNHLINENNASTILDHLQSLVSWYQ